MKPSDLVFGCMHTRNDRGQLLYGKEAYNTLDEFVLAQQKNLNLKMYCPGSPYTKLWEGRRHEDGQPAENDGMDEAYTYFDPAI